MNDENWKEEFKAWKPSLKPLEIKLLKEGPQSQSQTLMLCDMWCEWKNLSIQKNLTTTINVANIEDPWDDKGSEVSNPS